jgi:hypothetical protein
MLHIFLVLYIKYLNNTQVFCKLLMTFSLKFYLSLKLANKWKTNGKETLFKNI